MVARELRTNRTDWLAAFSKEILNTIMLICSAVFDISVFFPHWIDLTSNRRGNPFTRATERSTPLALARQAFWPRFQSGCNMHNTRGKTQTKNTSPKTQCPLCISHFTGPGILLLVDSSLLRTHGSFLAAKKLLKSKKVLQSLHCREIITA